ncbi:MAG TPA: adenylate/guanylate cyclase domain-containing protein [Actinomycetes bacterium]|jgi:adenylate cyclase|nr:adenylate/guanylate cyclase domain-containing protein [Actinomycetes bacterium]
MDALNGAQLAELAGVSEAEIGRMVDLGVLVAREGAAPFLTIDLRKVRLALACERAGLPMDGIAAAIRAGRLSFAFLEASPYHRWAVPSDRTYRQVSEEAGVPLDVLRETLESMGFAWTSPDEPMREDELEVVPVLQMGISTGLLDKRWMARVGRAYAEGLRLAAMVETEIFQARFEGPALDAGLGQRQVIELASELAAPFMPLVDRALMGIYRRQQELVWTDHQVLNIEAALEEAGAIAQPDRVPAVCFIDLAGYTRLTEEQGDQAAAELASTLAVLVERSSRAAGGTPVKWLGDGVMLHFRRPAGAVEASLAMVGELPEAGLPPAHVGVAAGPVVVQGGDYFGRTVNLAARVAARAQAGQVLVTEAVAAAVPGDGVAFSDLGELRLKGFSAPVRLLEARRA